MRTAIIDYGSGNLRSAAKAFERVLADSGRTGRIDVTADADAVASADRVVLPGVGAFGDCLAGLTALDGMVDALRRAVIDKGRPFLGICVGMQLMAARGLEHGTHSGLGWIHGDVVALVPKDPALKVPHMGWNTVTPQVNGSGGHPLFNGLPDGTHFYFVHGYHLVGAPHGECLASTDYGGPLVAAVGHDNLAGTQFHPEKSQAAGLALIGNFLAWTP